MEKPSASDPAGVWQAWVASAAGDARYDRFALVPEHLRERVASHMRTVVAIERYQQSRNERRAGSGTAGLAHGRMDRPNPYGG